MSRLVSPPTPYEQVNAAPIQSVRHTNLQSGKWRWRAWAASPNIFVLVLSLIGIRCRHDASDR